MAAIFEEGQEEAKHTTDFEIPNGLQPDFAIVIDLLAQRVAHVSNTSKNRITVRELTLFQLLF